MRKQNLLIILIVVFVVVMFLNGKESVSGFKIFETVDGSEESEYTVRLFNQYPDGSSLELVENTKLVSDENTYLLKESTVIPGLDENNDPGYVDVVVIGEDAISPSDKLLIPGLSGTIYEQTTWVESEYIEEEEDDIIQNETIIDVDVLEEDEVWVIENSPYIVNGNILIPEGVTLEVEPGVEIVFNGRYSFIIEGRLLFLGEKKNTIKLYGAR
jgi:hypothetical protein